MSTELSIPAGFGSLPAAFAGKTGANDELGAGIASSYGIIGYRGKVWSIKHQGKETQLMRPDGDGARGSIEVVVVKASAAIAKIFYKGGYVEGSSSPPDCWSSNGVTPDAAAQNKQASTCAQCPMNAWGSRVTESGKQGKACSDSRRIAIVPLEDIQNEAFGGPMLLRIPAASLKDLKAYGDRLNSFGFPYYAVATRISFDPKEAYPKFVFKEMRPLTEAEASQIIDLRGDRRVSSLLSEAQDFVAPKEEDTGHPTGPSWEAPKAAAPAPKPAPAPAPAPAPKAVAPKAAAPVAPPVVEEFEEETGGAAAPSSFDDMLENIL